MLICQCNSVYTKTVLEFIETYPNLSEEQVKKILKIGQNCGCCLRRDCPNIDVFFEDFYENLYKDV